MLVSTVGALTGCGGKGGPNEYTMWLYKGQDTQYYSDYSENPVLNYLLKQTWNDKNLSFTFQVPPDANSDYQTMMANGEKSYPTLLQSAVAEPAPTMYQNDRILDITDYVKDYMPNYYALIQENEELRKAVQYNVDGKDRILGIHILNESTPYDTFGGMCYRRDWIVEYGKNPSTTEKFTGGYTKENDPDAWEDNVMFPSWYNEEKKAKALAIDPEWKGDEPFYISDWEWMFDIFKTAYTTENPNSVNECYGISMYYPGYTWAGGLSGCFGEGGIVWYADKQGRIQFGATSDSTKAYFECFNTWYDNGWLDQRFSQRTGDAHYSIDSQGVRSNKVGMWCGVTGDLGGRISTVDGIYVAGCTFPVNDVYGTDSCKYEKPRLTNMGAKAVGQGFFVMKGADKKDLPTLFKFLDYFYTEEGAALRTIGLNKAQLEEEGTDTSFYNKYKLSDGAYTKGEDDRYVISKTITNDSGDLTAAASLDKFPGIQLVKSIDYGYAENYENSLKAWVKYKNEGYFWGSTAFANMSVEDVEDVQDALNKVLVYMERNAHTLIKGGIKDAGKWRTWCNDIKKFKTENISAIMQPYYDTYGA